MATKLTHPDAKDPIEVRDDMADAYLSQGWQRVDKASTSPPAKSAGSKSTTKKG